MTHHIPAAEYRRLQHSVEEVFSRQHWFSLGGDLGSESTNIKSASTVGKIFVGKIFSVLFVPWGITDMSHWAIPLCLSYITTGELKDKTFTKIISSR